MSDTKLTAEESCRSVLKSIVDACDQESLARAGGYLFRYVQKETVLRDCGQRGVCRTPPGCARHWEERNRELVRENEVLRSNSDHLSSENASLSRQVESMSMRIETLAEELAKPEDVRLREVLDAMDGRAVIFDGLGARVRHLLDEMDEWIGRAGEAERLAEERLAHANRLDAWRFRKAEYLADIARLTKERDEARAEVSEILAASDATQSMPTQACRDRDRALAELRDEKKRSTRLRQAIDDMALKHVHGTDGAQCSQCELFKVFCCCGAENSRAPHECECANCEACDWTGSYLFADDPEPTEGE